MVSVRPRRSCGLYYKHVTIVNYASSSVHVLKASLNDDARVIIYNRHMFIVQATGVDIFLSVQAPSIPLGTLGPYS